MRDAPLTPEQLAEARRALASEAAKKRWAKSSKKARKAASDKMHEARRKLPKKTRSEIARKAGKAGGRGRPKKAD